MKDKKGFTLAEVLITLGIIGVVAALTIPTLIANNQKTQYVTQLKKAYTEFNQALIKMAADNACAGDLACAGIFDADKSLESVGNEFVKYFKVTKNCEANQGPIIMGCLSDNAAGYYDGTGGRGSDDDPLLYRFITSDGMAFALSTWQNNCGSDAEGRSRHITNNVTQVCGTLMIDVNGPTKGPNNHGRDIFSFYITNGKGPLLYPIGGADFNPDAGDEPWQDASGNPQHCYPDEPSGSFCSGRVIEEGWKMNY